MPFSIKSVQTRLIAAFCVVLGFALGATAVGMVALFQVQSSLDEVVEEPAPRVAAAQGLEAASSAITGELAAFARSRDTIDSQISSNKLAELLTELRSSVEALSASGMDTEQMARVSTALDDVAAAVEAAAGPVGRMLDAAEAREAVMAQVLVSRQAASDELEASLDTTTDEGVIETLLRANMAVNLAATRYAELAAATSESDISRIRDEFDYAADELLINLAILGEAASQTITGSADELLAHAEGADGLFALRARELTMRSRAEELVEEARIMDAVLAGIVAETRDQALAAQAEASAAGQGAIGFGKAIMLVMALAAIVAGGAVIVLYVSRNLLARLKTISTAMERLASGDVGEPLNDTDSDEIATMTRAVNVFRDNAIERRRLEAERSEDEATRAQRSQAIEALISQFESVSQRALGAVGDAAAEMESAALALDQSSRTASETTAFVNASSGRAAENVDTVAAAAEEMTGSIAEIAQQISRSSEIARDAADRVDQTNHDVAALNEAASRIGDIISLINDIAEQTNLLALNATIEAARAGEAGKGFAVVASEVKSLAEQTGKATSSIADQISGIQGATGKAVGAIGSIGEVISEMNNISAAIAAAMEEQRAAASEITRAAHEAATGAREVSQSISSVDAAASETGQCAAQVNSASGALNTEASGLQKAVTHFLSGVRSA